MKKTPNGTLSLIQGWKEEDGQGDQHGKAGDSTPRQNAVGSVDWHAAAYRALKAPSLVVLRLVACRLKGFRNGNGNLADSSSPHHAEYSEVNPTRKTVAVSAKSFTRCRP